MYARMGAFVFVFALPWAFKYPIHHLLPSIQGMLHTRYKHVMIPPWIFEFYIRLEKRENVKGRFPYIRIPCGICKEKCI